MGRLRLSWLIALALTAPVLAGCAGGEGEVDPPEPKVEGQSASQDADSTLEASAPDGKYDASYVLEDANVPGAKEGFESSSTYAFTFDECTDTECWGTVKAPAKGSYTWDGTDLVVTFDEIEKTDHCVDDGGQEMEDATYWSRTEHQARVSALGEEPRKLEGSYQQETVFSDFRNGCRPAGPTRQHADFTLVLERR